MWSGHWHIQSIDVFRTSYFPCPDCDKTVYVLASMRLTCPSSWAMAFPRSSLVVVSLVAILVTSLVTLIQSIYINFEVIFEVTINTCNAQRLPVMR
jgi:lipopolysaccharide/colanic/teichoic acid biosynthesis glycosyltransferase